MPKQVAKSGLAAKFGEKGRKAFEGHKADETNYGSGGDLPPGIEGGIAQLVDCRFDKFKTGDNTGEYFFIAAGVVVSPPEVGGVRIRGLRTQIGPEPMCDTPSRTSRPDFESHISWVLNELRKLGIDTIELDYEDLEGTVAALKEGKPHFRFRTWQGQPTPQYPNPRVNHEWKGLCEYVEGQEDAVVDETTAEPAEEETKAGVEMDPELKAWAEVADNEQDVKAQKKLSVKASEVGVDAEAYQTWYGVAQAIEAAGEGPAEEEAAEEEPAEEGAMTPAKGDVYLFKPPKAKKPIQVEVTVAFEKKELVNLKSLDDGMVYKNVPFAQLLSE